MNICVFGNCQSASIKASLEYLLPEPGDITLCLVNSDNTMADMPGLAGKMASADILITQEPSFPVLPDGRSLEAQAHQKHILIPSIVFQGFQPDMFYLPGPPGKRFVGPFFDYSSKLTLAGYFLGLAPEQTLDLYRPDIYQALGWHFASRLDLFCKQWKSNGIDISSCAESWLQHGRFMHTINHPSLRVVSDIVALAMKSHGIACRPGNAADMMFDPIMPTIWPSPPGLELPASCRSDVEFLKIPLPGPPPQKFRFVRLDEYIASAHSELKGLELETLPASVFLRHFQKDLRAIEPFAAAIKQRSLKGAALKTANPYHGLPDHHFWKLAVEQIPPSQLNPMIDSPFRVTRTERIATAGSCFAQHIARRLAAQGFNYLVTEQAPPQFDAEQARARSYGLFSARYGNIYTVKQLRQLCERAFGLFTPADGAWPCEGGFIDPFRPRIEPRPFASLDELESGRQVHLAAVRQLFATAETFIFTMGLTEAWRSTADGAVVPLPPGAVTENGDPAAYEFINFAHDEIRDDLSWTIAFLRKHNPGLRVILTVSPVPLVATFERRHVLTSTTASKSILRAVADEAARTIPDVMYFPSYEIIASPVMRGSYFAADLRSVTDAGVDHVMRVFFESCAEAGAAARESPDIEASAEDAATARIICDEEQLAARDKES